jgi:hypothetical protein
VYLLVSPDRSLEEGHRPEPRCHLLRHPFPTKSQLYHQLLATLNLHCAPIPPLAQWLCQPPSGGPIPQACLKLPWFAAYFAVMTESFTLAAVARVALELLYSYVLSFRVWPG